jgi:hypothetical protein
MLNQPLGLEVDSAGNLYIAQGYLRVRKVTPAGIITTVARGGSETADGVSARNRVRKISSAGGIVSTVAGAGTCGRDQDGGPAVKACVRLPTFVEVEASGNLFIADAETGRVRKVDAGGTITTIAGIGQGGFEGDGGPATRARLALPQQLSPDRAGNLYIADSQNHRLRRVSPDTESSRPSPATEPAIVLAGTEGRPAALCWALRRG